LQVRLRGTSNDLVVLAVREDQGIGIHTNILKEYFP
jgi:hypothetical protein